MRSPDRRLKRIQGLLLVALSCLVTAMPCLAQSSAGRSQQIWFAPRDQGPAGCTDTVGRLVQINEPPQRQT
jgi:hypothetical protein